MGREAKVCVICGKSFIPRKSSQQCCSSKCGNIKGHESMKHYYNCQYCGKPFWRENAFRMKYCGEDCRKAALKELHPPKPPKEKRVYIRKCNCCGNTFETEYANQVYCSKECSYEGNLRLKRKQWAAGYKPKTIICKECNTPFTTECGDTHSVFCCQSCADKSERRREHMTERHKEYMAGCKERRKKQISEGFVEEVPYDDIYTRDGGICQICGLPVHPVKNVDDNWDGTIDHIIPLSAGGEHSFANCQLAHRICNSLKRQEVSGFSIDWTKKSMENNYWGAKFEAYAELMAE